MFQFDAARKLASQITQTLYDLMKDEVREKLEQMRKPYQGKSYDDLLKIDWINLDPVIVDGKKLYPSIWLQVMPDDRCLLVVQLTQWFFLRVFGATDCIGFLLSKDGKQELVDEICLMNEVGHP